MIVERRILVIFGLVLLISYAAAIDLSPSTISSNSGWLIANDGNDQSTITVYALAGTPATPVTGAKVIFSLDPASQDLGTISPVSPAFVLTGSDGKATAAFSTSKKSGNATIIATISYDGTTIPVQVVTYQRIDHDTPQGATFENLFELPVGSITYLNVMLVDRWGNRIDNKKTAETIRLTMADDGGAGLQDGPNYITQKTYSTDAEGNVSAVLRISTAVRSNYIQMDPIGNIVVPPGAYIQGVADSEPYYIAQTPASPGSTLPANGLPENAVEIYYTVTDKYNNPITGASVYCSSSDGMSVTAPTNTWGRLRISFGPKEKIGVYTLNAVPLGNTSAVCTGINAGTIGYCGQDIEYYNTDPVDLTFTGNPQSMTSLDVNPQTRSILQARVMDIKGNPVIGQEVHFSLAAPTYPGGPYVETAPPTLSAESALVGADGYATIDFNPGAFATSGVGYNAVATGQVVVTATWTNDDNTITKTQDVTLVWKNYPYISTSSLGDCGNSQVGDKINITIRLFGDGAALMPKPIDVVMCTDRSGSMLLNQTDNIIDDRMVHAMNAGKIFNAQMSVNDRVGLVSFGDNSAENGWAELRRYYSYQYGSAKWVGKDDTWNGDDTYIATYYKGNPRNYGTTQYASIDQTLSFTRDTVDTSIGNMVPAGGTPMREGLYRSVKMLIDDPRSNTVAAVVLLTDGAWNTGGNPQGGSGATSFSGVGTGSVITWAKNNNIKIYAIALGSDPSQTELQAYADETGGKFYAASTASQLAQIYTDIAGDLQETAGGETEIDLNFGSVNINDNPGIITEYMDYEYHEGYSTYINKSNITKYGVYHQLISLTQDDTQHWLDNTMTFPVGTIKLNETWSATFQLTLIKAGKIDLFGGGLDSSTITFKDYSTTPPTTQTGFIPAMQCRVRESIVNTGFGSKTLLVDHLAFVEGASPDPNVWTIKWDTTYDGDKTVQEAILYRLTGETQWKTIPGGLVFISTKVFEETKQHTISTSDTALWPPGKCFDIQIVAGAEDANAAITNPITKCKALPGGTIFIKLE